MKKSIKFKLIIVIIFAFVLTGLIVSQLIYYFKSNYTLNLILNNPFRLFLSAYLFIILLCVIISIIMTIHNKKTLTTNRAKHIPILLIFLAVSFALMLLLYYFSTSQKMYELNDYKKPFLSIKHIENGSELTKVGLSERDFKTRDKIQTKKAY